MATEHGPVRSLSRSTPPRVARLPLAEMRLGARFVSIAVLALIALELLAAWLTPSVTLWLHVALVLTAWELSVQLIVTHAGMRARHDATPSTPMSVSVLVAAWNEEHDIVRTVRAILAQEGIALEVIVADDGSTDRTRAVLAEAFALVDEGPWLVDAARTLRVITVPHAGKGAALEAARRAARHPILVTVDADTVLGPGAIEHLTRPFVDVQVEAAAGAVVVRDARDLLSRFQHAEYLETTFVRHGWSQLGLLEQVPGAFAALRASSVEHAGGFPIDSLTEDYELIFRLYARAAEEGRTIHVPTIVDACAYTEPPRTLAGLARQRTRWFAGFLVTLVRFRALLLDPRARAFGLVRLPIKLIDALLPPWSLLSLLIVGASALASDLLAFEISALGLMLLAVRTAVDVAQTHLALVAHRRAASRLEALEPSRAITWLHALADAWSYVWLRQVLVLRAYPFALTKGRVWETSR